jgi:hypothetical protein
MGGTVDACMQGEQADRLAGGAYIQGLLKYDKSDLLMAARDVSSIEEIACEKDPLIIRLRERRVKQG